MRIGKLRHRITLQRPVMNDNRFGESIPVWEDFATVSASIEPRVATESIAGPKVTGSVWYRIRMRYLEGIDSGMRIAWNGRLFEITGVINPECRNREIEIAAYEAG